MTMRSMSTGALALCLALAACTGTRRVAEPAPRLATQITSGPGSGEQWFIAQQERQLVRRAQLQLEVERSADVPARATALTTSLGGYVQSTTAAEKSVSMVLRVPAASLDVALDSLARLGKVESRTVSADDVTEQTVDLDARVASLRAARDRLRELHSRAGTVAELVAAEGELARVQGELDSLEGRLKLLRGSVALAEIDLRAQQKLVLGPLGVLFAGIGKLLGKLFVIG